MVAVLLFNQVDWFRLKTTLEKLVTMATKKRLSLIYEIENFANACLGESPSFKVMVCSVLEFWAIYLARDGKHPPPPPGAYSAKSEPVLS